MGPNKKSLSSSTVCSTTSLLQDAQDLFIFQFALFIGKDFLTEVLREEGERERERNTERGQPSMCSMHVIIPMAYKDDLLNKSLVGANFGLLQGRNGRSNPCDEGELLSPTHLVPSLETDVRICPLVICKNKKNPIISMIL